MSRVFDRELAAEKARSAAVAAHKITPERYAEIYSAARDWAEDVAATCGDGKLPCEWVPTRTQARSYVGDMPHDQDLCVELARDAFVRLRKYWL